MSCLILALALSGCASAGPPRESGDSWVLAWEDDFNGTALNPERWRVTIQGWNWNEELQAFTRENVAVRDGCLELSAKRESWRGPSGRPDKPGVTVLRQYTSGEASTRDSWTYGKFEARVKAAGTRGVVSAFWMVPLDGDWPPEIDIAEILGRFPFSVYFTNHYNHPWNHRKNSFKYHGTEDYSDGFHVFAAEWEPGAIRWYVDGVMRARCAGGVPDERFVMKFTLAVGSEWTGPPDGSSVFPQRMLIDWVRVYRRRGAGD